MYLTEVLAHKRFLDQKIEELRGILKIHQTDALATKLMELLEQRQARRIHINASNEASNINLGGTEVSINVAVMIRDTIKEKMELLTDMINNPDCSLDKLELMNQRDKYFNEYVLIGMGIQRNDFNVKVG